MCCLSSHFFLLPSKIRWRQSKISSWYRHVNYLQAVLSKEHYSVELGKGLWFPLGYCCTVSEFLKKILIGDWEYEIKKAVCVLPGTVDGRNHGKQVGRRERLDRMRNLCYFWWREVHVHVMLILSRSNFHPFLINTLILLNWSPTMSLYCLWMQANDLFFCEWLFINACSRYCTSVHKLERVEN